MMPVSSIIATLKGHGCLSLRLSPFILDGISLLLLARMQLPDPAVHAWRPLDKPPQLRRHRLNHPDRLVIDRMQLAQLPLITILLQSPPLLSLLRRPPPHLTVLLDLLQESSEEAELVEESW